MTARKFSNVLPHARVLELEGIGHMGPVTHSEVVNSAIEIFLMEISGTQGEDVL